jgi:hypothetical protein
MGPSGLDLLGADRTKVDGCRHDWRLSAAWSVPFHHHDSHRRLLLGRRRPDFLIVDMTMLLFHESSTQYIRKGFDSGVHEWKQIGYVDGLALWAKSFREIHHNL